MASRIVHVITHGSVDRPTREPSLFGIHRPDASGPCTSHVLGFQRVEHALALARGLEAYRRQHGTFPARDSLSIMQLTKVEAFRGPMQYVAVDAMDINHLTARLHGSGIVLSLLLALGDDKYVWSDLGGGAASNAAAVTRLNELWHLPVETEQQPGVPRLLPKPKWPPSKSLAALSFFFSMLL